ncbi:hypothetical protein HZC30_06310 [Candidatus Woesearchaeota archaeon]|nr:hypothetical protein [Candidatus Woesearchaeota archaeon]
MALNDLVRKLGLGLIVVGCGSAGDESAAGCKNDSDCKGNRICIDGECVEEGSNGGKDTVSEKDTIPPKPEKQCYGPWLWQECQQGDYGNCVEWSETYTCPTSTICREGICEEIVWNCYNGPVLKLAQVCDGSEDCPLGDDEESCESITEYCKDLSECFNPCSKGQDYSKNEECWVKCWAGASQQ